VAKCASGSTNIFKVHIMQALIENGFADRIYGDLYQTLFSKDKEGSINHVPDYEDIFSILEAIHEAGGIAILANPQKCKNEKLLEELVARGLDGIEIYTPEMSAEDKEKFAKYAKKNKLLTTGGSNFKGLYNKYVLSVGDCDLPDECVQELNSYKARKRKAEKKKAAEAKE
jgi:predicted metal-dependent phosphoesterase TrpH